MSSPANTGRRVVTGLFEIDLASGQVVREGLRIPLQDQPFRVLTLLLERPGQIVTREDLQTWLWPADTYVGFDEGLNTAIRKLRILFGDSADNPRFIETIPRRGYRFIAPVNEVPMVGEAFEHTNGTPLQKDARVVTISEVTTVATVDRSTKANEAALHGSKSRGSIWTILAALAAALVLVLVVVAHRDRVPPAPEKPLEKHEKLAVLPFQNLSNDPGQEYFSDGLTEETITDLGQLSPAQLGVIARTSAMTYKHTNKTVSQIGHELGVDYILEGSVRREPGRARISAQLIRVSDQTHLWAQSYDARNLNDLIDVQNAIARAIADAVQVNVSPQHRPQLAQAHPVNPEAYDLYLKGRFFFNQRTPASMRESIEYFKKATVADPEFALGYAGLAYAYDISNIIGILSPKDSFPLAKAAATRALELDPNLAEAYAALGMEKSHYDFDLQGAKAEFQKAIELNPNSAYAHFLYSNCYLMPMGLRAEAIVENKKALELDPLSLPINNFLGESYLLAGDYPASEQQFKRAMAMDANFPLPHAYLAELYQVMGRFEEAIDEREKGDVLSGWTPKEAAERAASLSSALKTAGEKGYWRERLAQDIKSMQRAGNAFSPSVVAWEYAEAGEKDKAFEWLEKSYQAREGGELTLLAVDPVWNNLHGDPRFSDMLRRIGLPEPDAIEKPTQAKNHL